VPAALLRPFCRAGFVITTHRVVFLYSNGGSHWLSLTDADDLRIGFWPPSWWGLSRRAPGTITFRYTGTARRAREMHGVPNAHGVYDLLVAVQQYWATGQVQCVELPDCQCVRCGYSLAGHESGRCPECGRPAFPPSPTTDGMVTIPGPDPQAEAERTSHERAE